jgi:hypothetical protein
VDPSADVRHETFEGQQLNSGQQTE